MNNTYDVKILEDNIPKEYDLIIVDGPTGSGNREGYVISGISYING